MQLILGSQSPRRKEILEFFSVPFIQASPSFDEDSVPFNGDPEEYVCALSKGKGEALRERFPEALILTADTIVFREGKVYGKPKDMDEAIQILSELAGEWHAVYTGVTVQNQGEVLSRAEVTHVLFHSLTLEEIRHYLACTHWRDKAGGYAIQGKGGIIVRKINGCYYNVMGLPLNTVESLLSHFGVELWNHL
jgi:septum formation protein